MTDQEWFELEKEYFAVFGERIPRMMLPADENASVALVREAIKARDDGVFEKEIPAQSLI